MKSPTNPTFRRDFEKKASLAITDEVRCDMDIQDGDVFVAQAQPDGGPPVLIRIQDPLEFLGIEAIADYEAGLTVSLDDVAEELGIIIDRS